MNVITRSNLLLQQITIHIKRHLHKKPLVHIVEVCPRDGLQNEVVSVPTDTKIEFINKLSQTGIKRIEVTSFVNPKWVPQLADNSHVYSGIRKKRSISYSVLTPNAQGLKAALAAGAKEIVVFTSASEEHSQQNCNCSIQESINRIKEVAERAFNENIKIRAYIGCAFGCPYEGYIKPKTVTQVAVSLLELGCYEISLCDTIGVGTKLTVGNLIKDVLKITTGDKLAIHCHDTYGQALVNILTALEQGIAVVDSSVSGLGGCPFAKGSTGNVATEDLVHMLHGMGVETGVDLKKLMEAGHFICNQLKKPTNSKVSEFTTYEIGAGTRT